MSVTEEINDLLIKKLNEYALGLRLIDLYSLIKKKYPDIEDEITYNEIKIFIDNNSSNIYKPDRGIYRLHDNYRILAKGIDPSTLKEDNLSSNKKIVNEDVFYESFAAWLKNDQEECTEAKVLGGNAFGDKWGTPDVIGVLKSMSTDIIKQEIEILSAEIKTSINELITGFGQACSYKLFSHKVYLVIPEQSDPEELARIDSLCYLFGIGLVLFDCTDPAMPNYQIKNRAQKSTPDIFYINKYINKKKDLFNDLLK